MEKDVEKFLTQEALVILTEEFLDRAKIIFESCKEDPDNHSETKVDLNALIASLAEDDYFQDQMEEVVRETVDGDQEKLEDLLNRVMNDHRDTEISWLQFLGQFSKRGRLQGYNELNISPRKRRQSMLVLDAEQGNT